MAGNAGAGIFARMLSYCGCYLSNGEVPPPIVASIVGRDKAALERAVAATLIDLRDDGTAVIPDWLEFNPSRDDVEEKRRKDAVRKKDRLRADSARSPNGVHAESAKSPDVPARGGAGARSRSPSRPDPTHYPPDPPQAGGRKRDHLQVGLEKNAWCAEHFPGVQPRLVDHFAEQLRLRGKEPTVEALRPLLEKYRSEEAA